MTPSLATCSQCATNSCPPSGYIPGVVLTCGGSGKGLRTPVGWVPPSPPPISPTYKNPLAGDTHMGGLWNAHYIEKALEKAFSGTYGTLVGSFGQNPPTLNIGWYQPILTSSLVFQYPFDSFLGQSAQNPCRSLKLQKCGKSKARNRSSNLKMRGYQIVSPGNPLLLIERAVCKT
mmetsp:Transcript_60698/g.108263  ORF Transcript_60698/g.108263 Transcript_60698/m.108263 type:complete len:175 (-) Transcript_60698:1585-2109(-)